MRVPGVAATAGQAVVGVAMGSLVDLETLRTVAGNWLPVLAVTVATLALSLGAGLLLRLQRGISPVTGAFSMIAGGASGIIVMARELGADERMVAVLQYLRVLLIVVLMPVVATVAYGASPGGGDAAPDDGGAGWPAGLLFTVGCCVVGLVVGRLVRLPVAALLGPMVAAAVVDLTGVGRGAEVPGLVASAAFLLIGLQVGLSFTRESLRTIGRALPVALAVIVGLIVASAGLGAVLSAATGVECAGRLPRHHPRRPLRRPRHGERPRRGRDVRAVGPGVAAVRHAPERPARRPLAAPLRRLMVVRSTDGTRRLHLR